MTDNMERIFWNWEALALLDSLSDQLNGKFCFVFTKCRRFDWLNG